MQTETITSPELSKGQAKRQAHRERVVALNAARPDHKRTGEGKHFLDSTFLKAKYDECEAKCTEIEKAIRDKLAELPEQLKRVFEVEILKVQTRLRNQYRKKYGRSKYLPHESEKRNGGYTVQV